MLETTTDGFVALDANGRITYFNAASERLSGKGRVDVLGKFYFRVCPELHGTNFESEVNAALKTRANLDFEYFHEPVSKWFKVRATPNPRGGLSIFFHDITAHKHYQLEKETIHQQSFEILEAINEAFFALDSDDRLTYVNGNAERLWQKSREELLGKSIWKLFPHLVGTEFESLVRERMSERTSFVSSVLFARPTVINAHPCAGGACIYAQEARASSETSASIGELTFAAQEAERQRIARELHDSAGQVLAALAMGLRSLSESKSLGAAKRQVEQLLALVHRVTKELGYLSRTLYGTHVEDKQLESALRQLCADFAGTFGLDVRVLGHSSNISVQKSTRQAAFRIVQEALANVARHAKAHRVRVGVRVTGSKIYLKVVDDGRGFAKTEMPATSMNHMGLRTMRDRAELLGGTLTVYSRHGHGTCVRAVLPNTPGSATTEAA